MRVDLSCILHSRIKSRDVSWLYSTVTQSYELLDLWEVPSLPLGMARTSQCRSTCRFPTRNPSWTLQSSDIPTQSLSSTWGTRLSNHFHAVISNRLIVEGSWEFRFVNGYSHACSTFLLVNRINAVGLIKAPPMLLSHRFLIKSKFVSF